MFIILANHSMDNNIHLHEVVFSDDKKVAMDRLKEAPEGEGYDYFLIAVDAYKNSQGEITS